MIRNKADTESPVRWHTDVTASQSLLSGVLRSDTIPKQLDKTTDSTGRKQYGLHKPALKTIYSQW